MNIWERFAYWLRRMVHETRIRFSSEYERKHCPEIILQEVQVMVSVHEYGRVTMEQVQALVTEFERFFPEKIPRVAACLSNGSLACMRYAVELDPSFSYCCAEKLLALVRLYLQSSNMNDSMACLVREWLTQADAWFREAEKIAGPVEQQEIEEARKEIGKGFEKTQWVIDVIYLQKNVFV